MIPASMTEWLDTVSAVDPADLPTNTSTVAYAIRCAVAYRAETAEWRSPTARRRASVG